MGVLSWEFNGDLRHEQRSRHFLVPRQSSKIVRRPSQMILGVPIRFRLKQQQAHNQEAPLRGGDVKRRQSRQILGVFVSGTKQKQRRTKLVEGNSTMQGACDPACP